MSELTDGSPVRKSEQGPIVDDSIDAFKVADLGVERLEMSVLGSESEKGGSARSFGSFLQARTETATKFR